jgi:hypothetical protein
MIRWWTWPVALLALSAAVQLIFLLDLDFPLRPAVMVGYLLLCPGLALVRLIGVDDPWTEFTLAIGVSIALATTVPALMVYLDHALDADASLVALSGVTVIAVVADVQWGARGRLP